MQRLLYFLWGIPILLFSISPSWAQSVPPGADEYPVCEIPTQSPYEKELPGLGYFDESITDPIPVGYRINLLDENGDVTDADQFSNYTLIVQRLTERSYLVQSNVFQSYVYRGDKGLLMMDCGGHNAARPPFIPDENGVPQFVPGGVELANLRHALDLIGDGLPLKTLVLSHPHTDHVGHSLILKDQDPNLRIVASKQLVDHAIQYNLPIGLPDRAIDIVRRRDGAFWFEGQRFRLLSPTTVAHSMADSALISPDGVQMSVDLTGPGRLSFVFHSVADNPEGVILFNRVLLGEAGYECDVTDPLTGVQCEEAGPTRTPSWQYGIFGHFNIGSVDDVIHTLRYYRAQYDVWWPLLFGIDPNDPSSPPNPKVLDQFIHPEDHTVDIAILGLFHSQANDMYKALAPRYYTNLQWQSAWHDMMEINQAVFLYRSGSNQLAPPDLANPTPPPGGVPDFSPIPPGTTLAWGNWM